MNKLYYFSIIFLLGLGLTIYAAAPSPNPPSSPGLGDINPLKAKTLGDLFDSFASVVFYLGLILSPLGIIVGGFFMTTGVPSQQILGKKIIIYSLAFLGFAVITKWVITSTKDIIG